jgi:hypothetical protein
MFPLLNENTPMIRRISMCPLTPLVFVGLLVAGCAGQASRFGGDIASAGGACQGRSFKTTTEHIQCLDTNERPVVARDLPSLLYSYESWNAVRLSAANDYDAKVKLTREQVSNTLKAQMDENAKRINGATASTWPQDQTERNALKQETDEAANSACKVGSLWKSPSMVVNFRCNRDARMPILEKRVPAASDAFVSFFNRQLAIAAVYDRMALPELEAAKTRFNAAINPARDAFRSEVQAVLRADAAATTQQRQDIINLLTARAQTTIAVAGAVAGVRAIQYCNTHGC